MKRIVFLLLAMPPPLSDGLVTYADGSLITNSGGLWIHHSGTAGQMQVTGGETIVSGANSEDVHRVAGAHPVVRLVGHAV